MKSQHVPFGITRLLTLGLIFSLLVSTSAPALAQVYVVSSGAVGIGTSDPQSSKLFVNGSNVTVKPGAADATLTLESTSSNSYDQAIVFKDPGGSWYVGQRWQNSSLNFGIGTSSSKESLTLDSSSNMYLNGSLTLGGLPVVSYTWDVCADSNQRLVNCSGSSMRYKEDVRTLDSGLSLVRQLRPVRFAWKDSHTQDVGLIAEEVAKVDETFTSRNKDGEVEGVQYRKMITVLIRAVQEQQSQIDQLQATVAQLKEPK